MEGPAPGKPPKSSMQLIPKHIIQRETLHSQLSSIPLFPTSMPHRGLSLKISNSSFPMPSSQQRSSSRQSPLTDSSLPSPGVVDSKIICGKGLLSVSSPETCCILSRPNVSSFYPSSASEKPTQMSTPAVHTSASTEIRLQSPRI